MEIDRRVVETTSIPFLSVLLHYSQTKEVLLQSLSKILSEFSPVI